MIPTRSLPPLSYEVPSNLDPKVGSVVVAPLSGRFRLGVVVGFDIPEDDRDSESLASVWDEISLPEETVRMCEWASEQTAVPLAAALRAALPPGVEGDKYFVVSPRRGWRWGSGDLIGRAELKRDLGETAMKAAEAVGRIELSPRLTPPKNVEWAVRSNGSDPNFGRAHRQREVFEALRDGGGEMLVSRLREVAGASRATLRSLSERGAIHIESRAPSPVFVSKGDETTGGALCRGVVSAVGKNGASLWRLPTNEFPEAVAETVKVVMEDGATTLVLAPEIRSVELLVEKLVGMLPAGARVAAYHGGVGRGRGSVWKAARSGDVDVLVGTRGASLIPMANLGGICVVDEPNPAHRAEPGFEGLPMHARDIARRRAEAADVPVLFLSPTPSLRLYASGGLFEIPRRTSANWPSVRLVDVRGSGAALSSTLVSACREVLDSGGKVGVVVDRLGYATSVSCLNCGKLRLCPECDIPLSLHERGRTLSCPRCGRREKFEKTCRECGSDRVAPTGMAVEGVRERLSDYFGDIVGFLTANERDSEEAAILVGTAHPILARRWDAVVFPDADSLLSGGWMGSSERAFRIFHSAAESARRLVLAQTRNPEHSALLAALREDFPAFAKAEIPHLRKLGYPPFAHFASLVVRGGGDAVRRAVKSLADFDEFGEVEVSHPVSTPSGWRILMRSPSKEAVVRAATLATEKLSKPPRGKDHRAARLAVVEVEIDPEEV